MRRKGGGLMWNDDFAPVCRTYPDLVAVYESPDSELALLLRQTLVPLPEERSRWFRDTRRTVREVLGAFRGAGFADDVVVLQWRPLAQVDKIVRHWRCRYDGDPLRREELIELAAAEASDVEPHSALLRDNLLEWYRDMEPCWLRAEPETRRRLILRAHRWIAERVLGPLSHGQEPGVDDLQPSGRLSWLLIRTVPNRELPRWQPWISLLLTDFRRALAWPPESRDAAWGRWLFLIPYGINIGRVRTAQRPANPWQESDQSR